MLLDIAFGWEITCLISGVCYILLFSLFTDCEYGDRVPWCRSYSELDCSDPYLSEQCCGTCGTTVRRTQLILATTSTIPTTAIPTAPNSVLRGTTALTNVIQSSCPWGDDGTFCSNLTPMECYHYEQLCCHTCHSIRQSMSDQTASGSPNPDDNINHYWNSNDSSSKDFPILFRSTLFFPRLSNESSCCWLKLLSVCRSAFVELKNHTSITKLW